MLVARAPLSFAIIPAGAALGALLWLALGGVHPPPELGDLTTRLASAQGALQPRSALAQPSLVTDAGLNRPLFDLAPGGATNDPALGLQGLSITPGRRVALISIGTAPPVWLGVGESRAGVTLKRVDATSALVETLSGDRNLSLGTSHAAAASAQPVGPAPPVLPDAGRPVTPPVPR